MLARALRRTFGFVVGVMLTGSSAFAQVPAAPVIDYVYTLPPAWTATPYPDGLVLMSPPSATNERCVFTVWPMRPAGTNLLQDAYAVFQDVFRTYEPRPLTTRGSDAVVGRTRNIRPGLGLRHRAARRRTSRLDGIPPGLRFRCQTERASRRDFRRVTRPAREHVHGRTGGQRVAAVLLQSQFQDWPPSDQSTSFARTFRERGSPPPPGPQASLSSPPTAATATRPRRSSPTESTAPKR